MFCLVGYLCFFFFFQAEDGIRDGTVTGVRRVLFRSWRYTFQRARIERVAPGEPPSLVRQPQRGRRAGSRLEARGAERGSAPRRARPRAQVVDAALGDARVSVAG